MCQIQCASLQLTIIILNILYKITCRVESHLKQRAILEGRHVMTNVQKLTNVYTSQVYAYIIIHTFNMDAWLIE